MQIKGDTSLLGKDFHNILKQLNNTRYNLKNINKYLMVYRRKNRGKRKSQKIIKRGW